MRTLSEALPVIYSGVALGQVFKGVLKPDPALAFFDGLNRGALPAAELDDEETLRFLRRQDIAAGGDEPRLLAGACAGIRQTDRRTGE